MNDVARREGSRGPHGPNSTASASSHPHSPRFRPFLSPLGAERAITAISLHPRNLVYLAAGCADECVRIWDQRWVRGPVYKFVPGATKEEGAEEEGAEGQDSSARQRSLWGSGRITSLRYDPEGRGELLVSYSRGEVCLVMPGLGAEDNGGAGKGGRRVKETVSTEVNGESAEESIGDEVVHEQTAYGKEKARKDSGVVMEGGREAREEQEVQSLDAVQEVAGEASMNAAAAADKETSILKIPIPKRKDQELADVEEIREERRVGVGIGENEEEEKEKDNDGYLWANGGEKDVVMKYKGHKNERTMVYFSRLLFGISKFTFCRFSKVSLYPSSYTTTRPTHTLSHTDQGG